MRAQDTPTSQVPARVGVNKWILFCAARMLLGVVAGAPVWLRIYVAVAVAIAGGPRRQLRRQRRFHLIPVRPVPVLIGTT